MNQQLPGELPDARRTTHDEAHNVAARFVEVSEELHQDDSEAATAQRVVDGAVRAVPGCDDCSLTLRGRGGAPDPAAETSTLLGIAQGVVAVRYEISYEEAFAVLQRYSNETNVKLRELARRVKADRALPPQPQPDRPIDPGQPRSAGRTSRP